MQDHKPFSWVAILGVLLAAVVGTGAFWQWSRLKLDKAVQAVQLSEQLDKVHHEIILLTEEYIELMRAGPPHLGESGELKNKLRRIQARLDLLKGRFQELEAVRAELRGESPREINLEFVPPEPPQNISIPH